MPNNPIVQKAARLYELLARDKTACKQGYGCRCFRCRLDDFSVDYDRATAYNVSSLEYEMTQVRDELAPVVAGVIERQHCVGSAEAYGGKRGVRKTMLKDAVSIATSCVARLNRAINAYQAESNATDIEFIRRANGDAGE